MRQSKKGPIYIGALYGRTKVAKAVVMAALQAVIGSNVNRPVYAKAATADGLRVLLNRGFKPIKGDTAKVGCMFKLQNT
ncbi:MAG: hypothetical protein AAGL99_15395 [Pseudomonadota bacterium]